MDSDSQQQNAQLFASMERCLQQLRSLKATVLNAHNTLAGNLIKEAAHQPTSSDNPVIEQPNLEKIREKINKYAQQMNIEYERLENEAKALPIQTPPFLMVNKLNNFLLDCATNPEQTKETYSNARSVFDWSDSTANYINFAYDLFKISHINTLTQQRNRKLTMAHQWNSQNEQVRGIEPSNQIHSKFVELFVDYMKQQHHRPLKMMPEHPFELKMVYTFLERSVIGSVIEIKYFSIPKSRTSDGQLVCLQKLVLLVNNGIIEYVHFIAPHEDWHYDEIPGIGNKKQIDLSIPSRYELYQKLTIFGNMFVNLINSVVNMKILQIFFNQMARLITIDQICAKCKKKLRDFTPVLDHQTKIPVHLACR